MAGFLAARTARRLALAAAGAVALLFAAELGLRAARVGAPLWEHPDPVLGWSLRPYTRGPEHGQYAEVNVFGQRDVRHAVDKRAGVYRIAVLGDDASAALGLPLRDTWWWQLAPQLDRCGFQPGRKIEVLNFGVSGYSTAQEAIVLETAVLRYRPDLVLLQFSNGRDVRENSSALAVRLDRPFFVLDRERRLRLDESFVDLDDYNRRAQFRYELGRELSDRSRLLQLFSQAALVGRAHAGTESALAGLAAPRDARWAEAWRVTEALLERMRADALRNGARFAVLAAPHPAQLARGLGYPDERLAAFGARHGIPVIALAAAMRGRAAALYGADGEWTRAGHRAAAEQAALGLCRAFARLTSSPVRSPPGGQ